MRTCKLKGISFGLTSGIITTLGLMMGLYSGTRSKLVVIGGIIAIAIADAFSDALAIHISTESEGKYKEKQIWETTRYTFISKFLFAAMFIIPILLLELRLAIIVSIALGLLIMTFFNIYIARRERKNPRKVVLEHLVIAIIVLIVTYLVGNLAGYLSNLA